MNRSATPLRQGVVRTVVSLGGKAQMNNSTVITAVATAGLAASAALLVAAPALAGADVARARGDVTRYPGQLPVADAPPGATAAVHSVASADGRTTVTLHVSGFEPFAKYGAHAHTEPCGDPANDPKGLAAGPHYQRVLDPVFLADPPAKLSTDPAYANPQNEIWLDLTTNRAGNGHAKTVVNWQFEPTRRPRSVIIHEKHTLTGNDAQGKPQNGVAGKRVACIPVPF